MDGAGLSELRSSGEGERIEALERRIEELERANGELWRTNQRLARERLTAQDSAAASIAPKLDAAEAELERLRRTLSWRVTTPLRWPRAGARWIFHRVRPLLRALALRVMR